MRCFDKFREPYIVGAQKGPSPVGIGLNFAMGYITIYEDQNIAIIKMHMQYQSSGLGQSTYVFLIQQNIIVCQALDLAYGTINPSRSEGK